MRPMHMPLPADSVAQTPLAAEVERRRTFAIISHPDAGKTTLTEKLLLFGGAINLAGQVKAKRDRRSSTCWTRRATRTSPRTPIAR